uniref:Leucine-rich repeat-containing N-terminal plant-type domain-containing protein n=1 Tax=Aegilops tauschii subsp. strangulata TaxID=200361 RepID=A0A453G8S7_AEGTS
MKHLHLVGLLLLSCTCPLLCAAQREAAALVRWKASLDGAADRSLGPWSMANSTRLCRWRYITCDSAGHLTELNLGGATLNAGIGNLTSLVVLRILDNPSLRGAIPRTIGQLKHLAVLELDCLGLGGSLPEEIGNLTSLENLNLNLVVLTGSIPPTIGMLVKLRVLDLENNNLTGSIPMEIGNMTEVQYMHFQDNYLEGDLPGTISHLINLRELDVSGNQLGGHILLEFRNSSLLNMVDIAKNNFSGMFPPSVCIGGALRFLDARYNGFTGIRHQTFQNCTTLQYVDFTANNIVAELRECFSDHPKWLSTVAFSQNQLYGTLLTDQGEDLLCNLTSLSLLDLSSNALHGDLPKCFWDLPNLGLVDLSSNSFSGVVPFSRTCQENLNYLLLANNHFRGTFPLSLKKCINLVALDLGGNSFSGTIPSWASMSLPKLNFLRLSSNMFGGIIPQEILQFRLLRVLDLSRNKLTGSVPDDFTNLTAMAQEQESPGIIYADPDFFGKRIHIVWKNVNYAYSLQISAVAGIDLSGNSLSQEIPKGLTTLLGLRYLNLSGNHLSGCIPEDIGNLVLLESLDLSGNQLSGEIPPSLSALKSISVLNFSSNGLSGRIPTGSQLQVLDDPSIYSNNPGLCGFPLEDCINSSTPAQSETSLDEDREALWVYCFVAAGFIFGFWLYWASSFFAARPGGVHSTSMWTTCNPR